MAEPEADNLRIMQSNPQDADLSDETQDFRFLNMFKKYPSPTCVIPNKNKPPFPQWLSSPPMLTPQNRLRLTPSSR